MRREKICTCADLHNLGVKERAQVKLSDRKIGQTKMCRQLNFHLILLFCELEDRYAGKNGIRASPVGELSQH